MIGIENYEKLQKIVLIAIVPAIIVILTSEANS
jgi:hypothetical protein